MERKTSTLLEAIGQREKIKMSLTGFTLIEILSALIIISILASLAVFSYRKSVENNNERICKENLKVLQKAIDIYNLENDSLPVTLAKVTTRQIYLAYHQAAGKAKENYFTASLRNILGIRPAWAQSLARYYAGNRNVFLCPAGASSAPASGSCSVPSPFPPGGSLTCGSYTFNFTTDTINATTKRLIKSSMYALVFDSANRHNGGGTPVMLGITPGGAVGETSSGIVTPE